MNMAFYGKWFACLWLATSCVQAASTDNKALEIIRRADEIRSPNKPFRYTLTVTEYKAGATQPENKQALDISMRFMKPQGNEKADARSLVRFIYPPRDKGKIMLSDWYDLWFYTPELRRPMPISRQQRLIGQISNGDVIVTNFEYAYDSTLMGKSRVLKSSVTSWRWCVNRRISPPKVIYYVEKDGDNRPWKAAYYSQDDQLIKEVLYQDFQPVLGKTRPMKITVTDVRHGNNYSVMEYSDVRLESLPEFHFTKEYIQRGAK